MSLIYEVNAKEKQCVADKIKTNIDDINESHDSTYDGNGKA